MWQICTFQTSQASDSDSKFANTQYRNIVWDSQALIIISENEIRLKIFLIIATTMYSYS